MNSKIEFSVCININLHQEKLETELKNYLQTNMEAPRIYSTNLRK